MILDNNAAAIKHNNQDIMFNYKFLFSTIWALLKSSQIHLDGQLQLHFQNL